MILRLRFPKKHATAELQRWIGEHKKLSLPELRRIVLKLKTRRRYELALEILTWMGDQDINCMSAADHAIKLELMLRVRNLADAEEYFDNIHGHSSQKAACLPLLHYFVQQRDIEKADLLMMKLQNLGLAVTTHPFNEMMKLYGATNQFKRVPSVIQQMKNDHIPLNVLSYNLWMDACNAISGAASAENVYREMMNDKNVLIGWSTYVTLANIYIKSCLTNKALRALEAAEQKLSLKNRLGFFFLITLHCALKNKDGVLRLWEASKNVAGRITCTNYMCILSCLVKLDDINKAEMVFKTWESERGKYDIRVSNVLLGAYMRKGWTEKAESLHHHTLKSGALPNYKTWEILMEGWVRNKQMDKAIMTMKKGFSLLKGCDWRPPPSLVVAIAAHFEAQGNIKEMREFVRVIRSLNLMSLSVYKFLLRTHIQTQTPAQKILEMMKNDNIAWDEETSNLVECLKKINRVGAPKL